MALQDFIQALQEQDIVYSTPPKPSIRVIPPEDPCIKVIPPESKLLDTTPKVIKLKLNKKPVVQSENNQTNSVPNTSDQSKSKPILQPVSKPSSSQTTNNPVVIQLDEDATPINVVQTEPKAQSEPKVQPTPIVVHQPTNIPANPIEKPTSVEPHKITADDIFNSTGTEFSKKNIWMEYYEKACNSRKSNPIVDRMKIGRFTITPDNKVLLLPDYDIVGKDPDDVLKDKWF